MSIIDDHGRPEPPPAGDEAATLIGFLDYQRATLEWKTRGLEAGGLAVTVAASSLTLGGLLKHMAYVEDHWFAKYLHGLEPSPPWDRVNFAVTPDWELTSAADDSPEELRMLWSEAVARSRQLLDDALATGNLGQLAKRAWPDGITPNLRWILTHMIEEYARHNGHADLLREAIDGETGE